MASKRRSRVALVGIAFVAAACQTDLPTLEVPDSASSSAWCSNQPAWVSVSPGSVGLNVGQSAGLSAWVYDTTWCWMSHQAVSWHSNNPGVASVSGGPWSAGVHGHSPGTATVVASTWGVSGSAFVTVQAAQAPPVLTSIVVAPSWLDVPVGYTSNFVAIGRDQYGNHCSNWCGSPAPTWSIDDPNIAAMGGGWVTGLSVGTTTVRAASGGVSGTATLSVSEPGPLPPPSCADPTMIGCIIEP